MKTKRPSVLVISPAGKVVGRDSVEWYTNTKEQVLDRYFNIGDMVVYDSTLKLIDYDVVEPMNIIDPTEADISRYKNFDFAIVRASNFVHNQMNFHKAAEIIEALNIPVYCTGVGGQSADGRPYKLEGRTLRFWNVVADRCNLLGVRGTFSADVFLHNNIKNVDICGCPSVFRTRNRNNFIVKPDVVRDVAVSLRREVDPTYTTDLEGYLRTQRNLLLDADRSFRTTFTSHGEPEEKAFFFKDAARMSAATEQFDGSGWFTSETRAQMLDIYTHRHFFFLKVADYDRFIRKQDFAIGLRVHGVLPALANGVPAVMIAYDSRSQELADTHAIPTISLEQAAAMSVSDAIGQVSFDAFNKVYAARYDKMKFIHEVNGIPHRM